MMRHISFALFTLVALALLVWAASKYGLPLLPSGFRDELIYLALVLAGVGAFASNLADSTGLLRLIIQAMTEHKRRQRLTEALGRGPFDEATIQRSTRHYIRPKCTNIDPAQETELRHALVATREDLFSKVDAFLDAESTQRHLLILADSGTGKTSFVLNYYAHNLERKGRHRHEIVLVPLGLSDANERILQVEQPEKTSIILDALDEDTKAIADHRSRIRDLMEMCRRFRRVIVTCRSQFFPADEEIPVDTGIARIGPRKAGERGTYEFWKLYLAPLDDSDVRRYIKKRYPIWARRERDKAYALVSKVPALAVRPMLLAHIPDVIDSGLEIRTPYQLYEVMVDAWLAREASWVHKEALRSFSEWLAVDLYVNRADRGTERVSRTELAGLAQSYAINLDEWKLTGRSLLNRDATGNYKFAHRSIMEYLYIRRVAQGDVRCYAIPLTDQMKSFLIDCLASYGVIDEYAVNAMRVFTSGVELRPHALPTIPTDPLEPNVGSRREVGKSDTGGGEIPDTVSWQYGLLSLLVWILPICDSTESLSLRAFICTLPFDPRKLGSERHGARYRAPVVIVPDSTNMSAMQMLFSAALAEAGAVHPNVPSGASSMTYVRFGRCMAEASASWNEDSDRYRMSLSFSGPHAARVATLVRTLLNGAVLIEPHSNVARQKLYEVQSISASSTAPTALDLVLSSLAEADDGESSPAAGDLGLFARLLGRVGPGGLELLGVIESFGPVTGVSLRPVVYDCSAFVLEFPSLANDLKPQAPRPLR